MSVGSHQNATFGLAKTLLHQGHKVTYAGAEQGIYGEDLRSNVLMQGFQYKWLDPHQYQKEKSDSTSESPTDSFTHFANTLLEGQLFADFVEQVQPDIILLDIHLPIYAIAFHPFNIPLLFLSTELDTDRSNLSPPLTSSLVPQTSEQPEIAIKKAWREYTERNPLHPAVRYLIQKLSSQNGFSLETMIKEKCIAMFGLKYPELVLWPYEFEFRSDKPTDQKYYIGSDVGLDRYESYFDWSDYTPNKPLIYCAIGTVVAHEMLADFVNRLLATFRKSPDYQCIISAGRVFERLKSSTHLPENIHIYQYVPQLTILKRADLMITLAGANSIKEAITLGVPLLCYPFHSDQFGNAARVVHHKLGLRGNISGDSPIDIRKNIERVISNHSFSKSVQRFQNIFKSSNHERSLSVITNYIVK